MIAITFRFPHHGVYSSYHRLVHYLGNDDEVVDASMPKWAYSRYFNPRGITQRTRLSMCEKKAWKKMAKSSHEWVHYIYPEQGYICGSSLRPEGVKMAMTCHLPPDAFEAGGERRKWLREGLSCADAVIVMSPNYIDYYQSLAPQARVTFIPHGIDIHYFKPAPLNQTAQDGKIRLLTVGNMLRDFETLAKVINLAAENGADWQFQVVALRDRLDKLGSMLSEEGKKLYMPLFNISNERLLSLYQDSSLLYLPLLDATANNAVVEAMACGLPMLLSDFPATRAYAEDSADYISGRDPREAYEQIEQITSDQTALQQRGEAARLMAENKLSWEVIIERQRSFFESV